FLSPSCGFTFGSVRPTNFVRRRSFRFSMSWEHFCLSPLASVLPEEHGLDCSWRRFCFLSHKSRLKLGVRSVVTRTFPSASFILQQSGAFSAPVNQRATPFSAFTPHSWRCSLG